MRSMAHVSHSASVARFACALVGCNNFQSTIASTACTTQSHGTSIRRRDFRKLRNSSNEITSAVKTCFQSTVGATLEHSKLTTTEVLQLSCELVFASKVPRGNTYPDGANIK